MPSQKNREIARDIYKISENIHEFQQGDTLREKAHNACTAYQQIIVDVMIKEGYSAGIVSDINAQVKDLDVKGHTIGFVRSGNEEELMAFDATIAQNGEYHWRRKTRIWFGDVSSLSNQLRNEFGGNWDIFQIKGTIGDFS